MITIGSMTDHKKNLVPIASETSDASAKDWENEFDQNRDDATEIDQSALDRIRAESSLPASEEFDEELPTRLDRSSALAAKLHSAQYVDGFTEQSVTVMDPRASQPQSDTAIGSIKTPCPHCGVLVSPGYPKCPRCKSDILSTPAQPGVQSGGTSVVGRTVPWAIIIIAFILTGIIVYLSEREPSFEDLDQPTNLSDSQRSDASEEVTE